jgi:hypothetical protein
MVNLFLYPKINQKGKCKVLLKEEKSLASSSSLPRMEAHLNYMFIEPLIRMGDGPTRITRQ